MPQSTLAAFDTRQDLFTECEVCTAVLAASRDIPPDSLSLAWQAERAAFFLDDLSKEHPKLSSFTPEFITYWARRATEAKHPILRIRYAGMAWAMASKVGAPKNVRMAHAAVDTVLELAQRERGEHEIFIIDKLAYALEVAISLGDKNRLPLVRSAIIAMEEQATDDRMLGLWGFSYDLLIDNKKADVLDAEETQIIRGMEERLARLMQAGASEFSIRHATDRLVRYYRKKNSPQDVRRLADILVACVKARETAVDPALAKHLYEQLEAVLRAYGMHDMATEVLKDIRRLGPAAMESMTSYEASEPVPEEEIIQLLDETIQGTFQEAIRRIIGWRLPNRDFHEKFLRESASRYVAMHICPPSIQDAEGRTTANLGSLDADFEAYLAKQVKFFLVVESPITRRVFSEWIARYTVTPDLLISELSKCPLFNEGDLAILRSAMIAYLRSDALAFIHIAIPRIETAMRRFVEFTGGTILRPTRKQDGYHLVTLDDLLIDDRVKEIFGPHISWYLRLLLTDNRGGVNLRNDVCHGMLAAHNFGMHTADLVLHAVLLVSLYRQAPQSIPQDAHPRPL